MPAPTIYFGSRTAHMRTVSSKTFTVQDIKEVAERCKRTILKAYITLNTVMYDHDRQLLQTILKEVKEHQIDAVVLRTFAVIEQCITMNIPVHVSTQANVSNIDAVKFYARFRMSLFSVRELTLTPD